MSCAFTPADRMEVTEVTVTPDIKLLHPAIIMNLQVHTPGYIITHFDITQVHRQVRSTFTL